MDKLNKMLKLAVVCLLVVGLLAGCSTIKKQEDVKGTLSGQVFFRDEPLTDSATMDTTVIVDQHRLAEPQIIQVDQNGVYTTGDLWAGTVTNLKVEHQSDQYGTLYNEFEIILDQVPAIYHIMMGGWSAPVSLPANINTSAHERMPWYDQQNKILFFTRSSDYDIYFSVYNEGADSWTDPQPVAGSVNTSANEMSPVLRGNNLYFTRYTGDDTNYDIFMATWDGNEFVNAQKVEGLSDKGQNWNFWINESETLAYYISNVDGNLDVYKAHKEGENWVKDGVVQGLSSSGSERGIFYEENEGKFYILSNKDGDYDIFVTDSEDAEWKRLNNYINSPAHEGVLWTNGEIMFFNRAIGNRDIYFSEFIK